MHQLFIEDQRDRSDDRGNIDWAKVTVRDKERRERVRVLLTSGLIKTGDDFHDAAFIFQHGDKPDDYLFAHVLAMAGMELGNRSSRWIAAATLDRYLRSINQPQVFGTQYFQPQLGAPFTQEPYNVELIAEPLRARFCVQDRESQKATVEALTKNLPFPKGNSLPVECNQK